VESEEDGPSLLHTELGEIGQTWRVMSIRKKSDKENAPWEESNEDGLTTGIAKKGP